MTGSGVRISGDKPSLVDRAINSLLLHVVMPAVIRDGISHAKVLQDAEVDWTIIRGLILTNGPEDNFKLTERGPAKLLCPRADIAQGILQIIEDDATIGKALIVSN